MKGLIYPLVALIGLGLIIATLAALVIQLGNIRRRRAIKTARWESYLDLLHGGTVEIGIRQVARWGNHQEILQHEIVAERIPMADIGARYQARTDADAKAFEANTVLDEINLSRRK